MSDPRLPDAEGQGDADATEPSDASPPATRPTALRRVAPLLLVVGAGLAAWTLAPRVPHERTVELRAADPATLRALRIDWMVDGKPEQGASWSFDHGAPSSLRATAHLPDGRYEVHVTTTRADGRCDVTSRAVRLDDASGLTLHIP